MAKRSLENIADSIISRRKALATLGGLGLGLLVPGVAKADLNCYDDMFSGTRTCTARVDTSVIFSRAENCDDLSTSQEKSMWCWAACIEMVFSYWGYTVPQERIVQNTWGSLVNFPGTPYQILANLNRGWTDESGQPFGVSGNAVGTTAERASYFLGTNSPLIIGTHGHAMVLRSMKYTGGMYGVSMDSAEVLDPWPGKGERELSSDEWRDISFAATIMLYPDRRLRPW